MANQSHFRLQANPGNGHVSHLVPLYPLNHITSANATLFQAAATSLQHRLAYATPLPPPPSPFPLITSSPLPLSP
jgi:hypothetical protein